MYRCTTIVKRSAGITVNTPTAAAMFHSIGLSTVSKEAAPSGTEEQDAYLPHP